MYGVTIAKFSGSSNLGCLPSQNEIFFGYKFAGGKEEDIVVVSKILVS